MPANWGAIRRPPGNFRKRRTEWWAREVRSATAIPMACIYKPTYLHSLNAKVYSERLQTTAADNRQSRDSRETGSAGERQRRSLSHARADNRGLIASPHTGSISGNMTSVEQAGGTGCTTTTPSRPSWNGTVTGTRRTTAAARIRSFPTGCVVPPSHEDASLGRPGAPGDWYAGRGGDCERFRRAFLSKASNQSNDTQFPSRFHERLGDFISVQSAHLPTRRSFNN